MSFVNTTFIVHSTFKIGCPSYIYVTAHAKDLVVEKMEVEHTHSCDPELVALYPERRSLSHIGSDDGDDEVCFSRIDVMLGSMEELCYICFTSSSPFSI